MYKIFATFYSLTICFLLAPVVFYSSCDLPLKAEKKELNAEEVMTASLDAVGSPAARESIHSIICLAECSSPQGSYSTEMHTDSSGYSYFKQTYSYKPDSFEAIVQHKTAGWSTGPPRQFLSPEAIAVIRGHEFLNLVLQTDQRFSGFEQPLLVARKNGEYLQVNARNETGDTCTLFFDPVTHLFRELHFQNPGQPGEIIQTRFSDWRKVNDLQLPHHVEIIQAGKNYRFDFIKISLNDPGFRQKII
ncbi:MAG: hypothetical protein IPG86_01775 [Chitinophagaceae bacterium]|nr:hypothetical protein [Chitinophagaceae bacterium]